MTNHARRWSIALGYLALMYWTTYVINSEGVLEGAGVAHAAFLAAYIIAAIALLVLGLVKFGVKNDYAWICLGIIVLLLMMAVLNLSDPKGRLHFLEYGLFFVLVYRALKMRVSGFTAYASAIILTCAAGVADEFLQSLYGRGFFDMADVLNNTFAAYLAAGVSLVWERC